jgi:hypothetical protein
MNEQSSMIRIDGDVVVSVPEAFAEAVEIVRRDGLRGLTIREDWQDSQPGAPVCDLSLLGKRVPNIKSLGFAPGVKVGRLANFESLQTLENLQELSVHEYPVLDLERFPNIRTLFVRDSSKLRGIRALSRLRNLHVWGIRSVDLSQYEHMEELESIVLVKVASKEREICGLDRLLALRNFEINHSRLIASVKCPPVGVQVLKVQSCPKFVDFSFLSGDKSIDFLFSTVFDSLAFLPSMSAITRIGFDSVTDGDLSPVLRTPTLQGVFCPNKKHHSHAREALQADLDGSR